MNSEIVSFILRSSLSSMERCLFYVRKESNGFGANDFEGCSSIYFNPLNALEDMNELIFGRFPKAERKSGRNKKSSRNNQSQNP
jgi:hypothetical protein